MTALPLAASLMAMSLTLPPVDYTDNPVEWNAIGYLQTTAEEARVDLALERQFNLGRALPGDILFLVYPTTPLPSDEIISFVRDGGYLIIADDHGGAAPLLAALGITRTPTAPHDHTRWYRDLTGLPILSATREHFLFFNVESVTANYPAGLRGDGEPLLSYDGGHTHLIVEGHEGRGGVLVLADSSLFLNEMMRRFYGNKQLAANVLRYYCQSERCRVDMVPPGGQVVGTYRSRGARFSALGRFADGLARTVNTHLQQAQVTLAERPSVIAIFVLVCVFGLFLAVAPISRQRLPVNPPPAPLPDPMESSGAAGRQRGLVGRRDANYAHLARHLLSALPPPSYLDQTPEGAVEPEAEAARLRIRAEVDSLLSRDPPIVDAPHFERLYHDVRMLSPQTTHPARGVPRR